jgi:trehalose-6-phosphatase
MRALDSLFETSNSHLLGLEGNFEILSIDGETKYRFLDRNALAAFERTIETYVRSHAGISFDEDQLIAALHIGQAEKDLFRQAFKSLAKRYKKNPRYDPGFHVEETQVITGTGKNKKTISKKHLRFLH